MNNVTLSGTIVKSEIVTYNGKNIWKSRIAVKTNNDNGLFVNLTKFLSSDKQKDYFASITSGKKVVVSGRLDIQNKQDENKWTVYVSVIVNEIDVINVAGHHITDAINVSVEEAQAKSMEKLPAEKKKEEKKDDVPF